MTSCGTRIRCREPLEAQSGHAKGLGHLFLPSIQQMLDKYVSKVDDVFRNRLKIK